jgi:hypothetical protein
MLDFFRESCLTVSVNVRFSPISIGLGVGDPDSPSISGDSSLEGLENHF